jgi:predicted adenine nucleotide alpha hydrolase (AANH) superfamily ATPase
MEEMLLHTCCGPCASAVMPYWSGRGVRLSGLFFNPNIHPFQEWKLRAAGALQVAERHGVELSVDPSYDPAQWFAAVCNKSEPRCLLCLEQRLERAAREAASRGCSSFSTTLAISPYQDHAAIQQAGERAAGLVGVEFVYVDLRPLYAESRRLSREWGVYRQKYCGCLLSEWERFREPRTAG